MVRPDCYNAKLSLDPNDCCRTTDPSRSSSAPCSPSRTHATTMAPVTSGSKLSAHSHTTSTRHAALVRLRIAATSRSLLAESLASQNSVRVAGSLNNGHPLCRCQKQPCTKMAACHFGKTISGLPGRPLACKRKRSPACHSARLTRSSGPVFLPRIFDIAAERCSTLITSAIFAVSGY
jgi:hypothetical protein